MGSQDSWWTIPVASLVIVGSVVLVLSCGQTDRQTDRHRYTETDVNKRVKPGFHYPRWRPELTGDRFSLPVITRRARVSTSRVDVRPVWPVNSDRYLGPSARVVETGLYCRDCTNNHCSLVTCCCYFITLYQWLLFVAVFIYSSQYCHCQLMRIKLTIILYC